MKKIGLKLGADTVDILKDLQEKTWLDSNAKIIGASIGVFADLVDTIRDGGSILLLDKEQKNIRNLKLDYVKT